MHAVLPHSPLHVKCLADTEEHVEAGHVKNIVVYVRETRLTNLFSNILIGISLFFLYYVLQFIPTAVLDGRCTKLINLKLRPKAEGRLLRSCYSWLIRIGKKIKIGKYQIH